MSKKTTLAVVQMAMSEKTEINIERATTFIQQAAQRGAQIVQLPELFENLYWCQTQREEYFAYANEIENHPFLPHFCNLAKELGVVLPISFFERSGQAHFNSLAMIDANGQMLGVYRKSHIPDGPGYMEKYYFNPGDTGFKNFVTQHGQVGAGICWDQWYPETARAMALQGAEILLYPTAIGTEPPEAGGVDTRDMWQRVMIGHCVANICHVAAANRVGTENIEGNNQSYYGSSFIADHMGNKLCEADRQEETILVSALDLQAAKQFRAGFGFFRDRRPDLYGPLLTLDGKTKHNS